MHANRQFRNGTVTFLWSGMKNFTKSEESKNHKSVKSPCIKGKQVRQTTEKQKHGELLEECSLEKMEAKKDLHSEVTYQQIGFSLLVVVSSSLIAIGTHVKALAA
jgi:hypothetical protein